MSDVIRVLVVDDSAYVRKVVSEMLARAPFVEVVGVARDGAEALEAVADLKPDVVTCDLNMPVLDGVGFIKAQMSRQRVPIVVISIAAGAGEQVLAALDAGAVDFVQKPTALATDRLLEMADELVDKVKAAARAPRRPADLVTLPPVKVQPTRGAFALVAIGISTGGPQALKQLIPRLPADCPAAVAIVMHMPLGYTEMYARKLDDISPLHVVEAGEGTPIVPGTVVLAQAGRHLKFRRDGADVFAHLDVLPLDTPHRPSVDALFHSAADVYGAAVLGVVMTGMGSDGREGAAWIKARGGGILTEAEDSCVVYGMPRSVVEAGLSDGQVPLERMAQAIMERI
jgi:two-component system chemotaxis response regulator CheB